MIRPIVCRVFCALLLTTLGLAVPAAAQSGAEGASQTALELLSAAQNLAEQVSEQKGQFRGRKIGPKLGSATNSLVQILTDFDIWACGAAVTALALKHRELAVDAARAMPADPALDRAVSDFGELIARLQELCNRHVYDAGQPGAAGANPTGVDADPPAPEEPPQPAMSAQERICQSRCQELYVDYLRAEREYDRARRAVDPARDRATKLRREAELAAQTAREADASSKERQRERERLRRIIEDPRSSSADRMAAAEAFGRMSGGDGLGPDHAAAAERAAAAARDAEAGAARAETRASALYDALLDIYNAWLSCIRTCVEQARLYNNVDVDPQRVFPSMPTLAPVRPPFYRPAPSATPAPNAVPARSETKIARPVARVVTTPVVLSGGTLVGAVYDSEGEPRGDQRISVTGPGGRRSEVRTGAGGRFSLDVSEAAGNIALAIRDSESKPAVIRAVAAIPSSLPASIPEFVALGSEITVATPYRAITAITAKGLALELPSATALAADRVSGVTSFRIPDSMGTGPFRIRATRMDGQETTIETASYAYLRSWIDQNELRSGQNAAFGFEVDFGTGPMKVVAVIVTEGPIVYDRAGQPQVLDVDAEGKTVLTGHIRAIKGSPAGIPFAITATFSRAR